MRIAILISGRGSNMHRLCDSIAEMQLDVEVARVISNKPCAGIDAAQSRGLSTAVYDRKSFASKQEQETALAADLHNADIDWVFLAGYMAVLSAEFVDQFAGRIINIHPSLLPDFKGLDTHARAISAGATHHGATVHLVTPALDDGPLIAQASLAINPDDTADTLAGRVLSLEHALYPLVLAGLSAGHLTLSDGAVVWRNADAACEMLAADRRQTLADALAFPA